MDDQERRISEAHDRGYQEGYDEARCEFLLKMKKWAKTGDPEYIAAKVEERITKVKTSGRWPDGWE